jgi:clan AA aspartic protease
MISTIGRRSEPLMGLTFIEGVVTSPTGKTRTVKFLVDSGASYSLLPLDVWQEIGLNPKRTATFTLADGTTIDREISECHIVLAGEEGHSPVILGQPGDEPLLGVITLENLGLVLDPFQRTLHAMKLRLG